MAVVIPQVVTEDRASGAQVIDGSLKFNGAQRLTRTPGTAGNRRTWTYSVWVKNSEFVADVTQTLFSAWSSTSNRSGLLWETRSSQANSKANLSFYNIISDVLTRQIPSAVRRDYSAWYHIVLVADTTQTTASDRLIMYINGVRQDTFNDNDTFAQDVQTQVNATVQHAIGANPTIAGTSDNYEGYMSQLYLIDGQALEPTEFGFTDPLTNVWRPKKYTGTYGTNGFWLPMDGNSLIGEDKSGNGNDWTPVNFGGSNSIDKATGAKPILRTVNGGNVASGGARSLHKTYAVTVPGGIGGGYYLDGTQKPALSLIRGANYTFDQSDSTNSGHPLRFATAEDAAGSTEYTDGVTQSGTPGQAGAYTKITVPHNAPDTLYYYCTNHGGMGGPTANTTDENVADPYAWKNVLGLPLVGSKDDVSNQINSGSTTKTITANGNAAASSIQSNFYGGSYYFDGSGDYLEIPSNADFQFGTGDWTIEFWWNGSASGSYTAQATTLVSSTEAGTWRVGTRFASLNRVYFASSNGSAFSDLSFDVNVNDGNWHHVAVVRSSGTIIPFVDGVDRTADLASGSVSDTQDMTTSNPVKIGYNQRDGAYITGYLSDLRIYKGVAKYTENFIPASTNPDILPDTPSGVAYPSSFDKPNVGSVSFDSSNDQLLVPASTDLVYGTGDFTWEAYVYSNASDHNSGSENHYIFDTSSGNTGSLQYYQGIFNYYNSTIGGNGQNAGGFDRDRWVHLAVARESGTTRMFIDGVLKNSFADSHDYGSTARVASIGNYASGGYGWNGFISNLRVLKGTALYTTDFTPPREPLTNVTNTSLICCQSSESATAAEVTPGTITMPGTDPTASRFNPLDNNIETVLGEESSYATLNALYTKVTGTTSISDGNLRISGTANNSYIDAQSSIPASEVDCYCEIKVVAKSLNGIGVGDASTRIATGAGSYVTYRESGAVIRYPGNTTIATVASYDAGDVLGMTISSTQVTFYKNGSLQGTYNHSLTGDFFACGMAYNAGATSTLQFNFGQRPFKYQPPKGFKAISLANAKSINKAANNPEKYFDTLIYTGTGTARSITGLQFQPDLVWIKKRTDEIESHRLTDSVRGTGVTVMSDFTGPENSNSDRLTAFNSDGFDLGTTTSVNRLDRDYVAWCWKAGGTAVSNTNGTITSSVSANTDAGFSIVTYTSPNSSSDQTVGHGLTAKPEFIMVKNRDATFNWDIYHGSLGYNASLLFTTDATRSGAFSGEPDTSVFKTKTGYTHNSTANYVAYCWHSVEGFSKIGSYTGNANADGPFIYTGFEVHWLLVKCSSNGGTDALGWHLIDTTRQSANPNGKPLHPNTAGIEDNFTSAVVDLLSNGFKIRGSTDQYNKSGANYVYLAFAEAPSMNLYGAAAPAR